MKYMIINSRNGKTVGAYKNLKRARNKRDKLDNEYGAYVYRIKEVESQRVVI